VAEIKKATKLYAVSANIYTPKQTIPATQEVY
jgi:hypothetical protein